MTAASPILDHLVLPTAHLAVARTRLSALGFTIASEGVHPFGTHNSCVYFEDDTFLEPLAIMDKGVAAAAVDAGNTFVARDRRFRVAAGEEGFSALVLASDDADADHARFVDAGISGGDRLDFSRGYRDAQDIDRTVSFRLAFAQAPGAEGAFFFTCQRVDAPAGGRGALAAHENSVTGIARVVAVSGDPARDAHFLSRFAGGDPGGMATGINVGLAGSEIEIVDPDAYQTRFGIPGPASDGRLRLAAIVFAGADTESLVWRLDRQAIGLRRTAGMLIVPPQPGQGAAFIFEDNS